MKNLFLVLVAAIFGIVALQASAQTPKGRPVPNHKDVFYGKADKKAQLLDVYLADSKSGEPEIKPVMIFIHGGGWRAGSKNNIPGFLATGLREGMFHVVSVEYRFIDVAPHPAQTDDCMRAIQFVRQNAKEWHINADKIGVTGGSAGGHLTLWVALHDDIAEPDSDDPVKRQSTRVTCALPFAGPTDWNLLSTIKHNHPAYRQLIGYKQGTPASEMDAAKIKDVSPLTFVSKDDPPILIFHGDADTVVPFEHAKVMAEKLKAEGVTHKLFTVPGGRHNVAGAGTPQLLAQALTGVKKYLLAEPLSILELPKSGTDPEAIDFDALPQLTGEHAVINAAQKSPDYKEGGKLELNRLRLNLHNYLAFHDSKFWCIWSDGPKIEDWPTQEIKYATSDDGLNWSEAKSVTGMPKEPYAFIARGLWIRDGELLALGAHYKGKGAFGVDKELELQAFAWDKASRKWNFKSKVYDNAINNFPPQKLPTGDWILTRRDARFNVTILIGGKEKLDSWEAFPVVKVGEVKGFRPDEPIFWLMPDKSLNALFRDNGGSQRLFHSTSTDNGMTWKTPVLTNFPNSTSKIFSLNTSRGYRVMISNANPKLGRRQLHLSISEDGKSFTRMAQLIAPTPPVAEGIDSLWKKFQQGIGSLQYPHAIEKDGFLWIALSRNKLQTEILKVPLDDVDALLK
ncbi:exo-alpha-sialidase [Verrucomicrobiales bacterium]|nr:exo-alpha-sialidase [Verrucomicrobiales bacterium]MDC0275464.1 exo-alpha-sialidase [Verrucomicrobiales bacterium]